MKFSLPDEMRECQLGTPSPKTACLTVKQSASGTRASSKLRPANTKTKTKTKTKGIKGNETKI